MKSQRLLPRTLAAGLLVAGLLAGQVSYDNILHANKEPQNWLTFGRRLRQSTAYCTPCKNGEAVAMDAATGNGQSESCGDWRTALAYQPRWNGGQWSSYVRCQWQTIRGRLRGAMCAFGLPSPE